MEKGNVIEMAERKKAKSPKMRLDAEQIKVVISTSLISILFLVGLANNTLFGPQEEIGKKVAAIHEESIGNQRSLASVNAPGAREINRGVLAKLSASGQRESAHLGQRPTALESLLLGELEGKYAARLRNGKLHELEFTRAASEISLPSMILNRKKFLKSNVQLLAIEFSDVSKVEAREEGVETYALLNKHGTFVGQVEFRLDASGRLLSMKINREHLAAN